MAKQTTVMIKLVSTADTGYFYVTKKNPRTSTEKFEFKKYDPIAKKHVAFRNRRSSSAGGGRGERTRPPSGRPSHFGTRRGRKG
jgi:large subunit ribosomal protein L33